MLLVEEKKEQQQTCSVRLSKKIKEAILNNFVLILIDHKDLTDIVTSVDLEKNFYEIATPHGKLHKPFVCNQFALGQ